jgi:predicted DNA-binding protein YlxM (UPF0122 family)
LSYWVKNLTAGEKIIRIIFVKYYCFTQGEPDMLEKLGQFVLLIDFYGPLLTEKQRRILKDYYENDFSLSEIANDLNISRQAVYDLIKRAEHQLLQYEAKLGLVTKFQSTRQNLEHVCNLLEDKEIDPDRLQKAVQILRAITESL